MDINSKFVIRKDVLDSDSLHIMNYGFKEFGSDLEVAWCFEYLLGQELWVWGHYIVYFHWFSRLGGGIDIELRRGLTVLVFYFGRQFQSRLLTMSFEIEYLKV